MFDLNLLLLVSAPASRLCKTAEVTGNPQLHSHSHSCVDGILAKRAALQRKKYIQEMQYQENGRSRTSTRVKITGAVTEGNAALMTQTLCVSAAGITSDWAKCISQKTNVLYRLPRELQRGAEKGRMWFEKEHQPNHQCGSIQSDSPSLWRSKWL